VSTRDDYEVLVAAANPVPDPEAAVDPARRDELLEQLLRTPLEARPRRRRRVPVRAVALAAFATAAAVIALLIAGERDSAPERFAVLPALAKQLTSEGRILHVRDRTVQVDAQGQRRRNSLEHVEENWTLLDDARVFRARIGEGTGAEELAADARTQSDYDPERNVVTIRRQDAGGSPIRVQPPVIRMARDAAAGRIPVVDRPVIDGRRTLKIQDGDVAWYIAEDAPVLIRQELRTPTGVQRSDFEVFEILPATSENRPMLEIHPPADARIVRQDGP
jgi:hypothetical protein